jgi:hypothetical protein
MNQTQQAAPTRTQTPTRALHLWLADHRTLAGLLTTQLWQLTAPDSTPTKESMPAPTPKPDLIPSSLPGDDPIPPSEPPVPPLDEPDPGVFHHEPAPPPD